MVPSSTHLAEVMQVLPLADSVTLPRRRLKANEKSGFEAHKVFLRLPFFNLQRGTKPTSFSLFTPFKSNCGETYLRPLLCFSSFDATLSSPVSCWYNWLTNVLVLALFFLLLLFYDKLLFFSPLPCASHPGNGNAAHQSQL